MLLAIKRTSVKLINNNGKLLYSTVNVFFSTSFLPTFSTTPLWQAIFNLCPALLIVISLLLVRIQLESFTNQNILVAITIRELSNSIVTSKNVIAGLFNLITELCNCILTKIELESSN